MPITVNNFDRFRRDVHAEQKRRLARAAIVVDRHAKQLLSVSGTGVINRNRGLDKFRGERIIRAVKRTRKTIYGAFPSAPGDPPAKQTGHLRRGVAWELVHGGLSMLARVGTNVKYGRWLELGTSRMHPRPWLVRSLRETQSQVRAILTAPFRWRG